MTHPTSAAPHPDVRELARQELGQHRQCAPITDCEDCRQKLPTSCYAEVELILAAITRGHWIAPNEADETMLRMGVGMTDFILPSGVESSEEAFIAEMRTAFRAMRDAYTGEGKDD